MNSGSLTLFTGPMFSGKTKGMVDHIIKYLDVVRGSNAIIINSEKDTRDNFLSSHHSNFTVPDTCKVIKSTLLNQINVDDYNLVGVDEAQFFEDLYDTVMKWLSQGKHVFCAGLSGDWKRNEFEQINKLYSQADRRFCQFAVCLECLKSNPYPSPLELEGMSASFSKRITSEQERESVDAKYIPVCGRHF